MKLKTLLTTLLTTLLMATSMSVNADWVKAKLGMYDIMTIEGSKIIDTVVSTGSDKNYPRVIYTTMYANKHYYR